MAGQQLEGAFLDGGVRNGLDLDVLMGLVKGGQLPGELSRIVKELSDFHTLRLWGWLGFCLAVLRRL